MAHLSERASTGVMGEIKFEKSDPIKTFTMARLNGQFHGWIEVDFDGMTIKGETDYYPTPDEALSAMKELLIKMYVKIDYKM